MERLLLIDTSSLVYRFFYALPELTNKDGKPAQVLYGLMNVLLKLFREEHPRYAAAALDRPEPTFRKEIFTEYKQHRAKPPDSLIAQLKQLRDILELFGIPAFSASGFEADDVLGTLADRLENKTVRIIILSGDLDMLQLVRGESIICRIIKTGVTETELYDEARVMARFGVTPPQLADYKGLVGDQSDGIPGIAGIGPKTATKLIQEFGSLEEIFENEALLDPKINKKLAGKRNNALLYRTLATIRRDVPIKISGIASLTLIPLDKERLRAYFHSLGFESLARRLDKQA